MSMDNRTDTRETTKRDREFANESAEICFSEIPEDVEYVFDFEEHAKEDERNVWYLIA